MAIAEVSGQRAASVRGRWRALGLIAAVQVLAMSVWFSASDVVPTLREEWGISSGGASWLTGAVQIGFVAGAVGSAVLNLADRIPARILIAGSAVGAASTNAAVALAADGLATAIPMRFLTGACLAGVYPVGMKLMASWFVRGRGMAIGVLVGALTLGSGSPHLIRAIGDPPWQLVLLIGSALALVGGAVILFVADGPYGAPTPPLDLRWAANVVRDRPVRLANVGYLGHMWELYAVWTWLPAYLAASLGATSGAAALSFVAIGVAGLVGAVGAGLVADRLGRTATTIGAMAVSGTCALLSAPLFGAPAAIVAALAVVWGVTVIADSAQFSVAVSELSDPRYVGTALTLQTAAGFLLTVASIRLVGGLGADWGWRWAFPVLAVGPAVGIHAMWRLRGDAAAERLAGGAR
ncbi:MAG: MFS transporter [Thermoleophilia bacterium]